MLILLLHAVTLSYVLVVAHNHNQMCGAAKYLGVIIVLQCMGHGGRAVFCAMPELRRGGTGLRACVHACPGVVDYSQKQRNRETQP